MAKKNSNYSILVDVELETSTIKKQLNNAAKNVVINFDTKQAVENVNDLTNSVNEMSLTYQEANMIMSKSLEIIGSMVSQVFELDTALTEFKKVSDLSGSSLEAYVDKLTEMGSTVARTGEPKCLSRSVGMAN